MAGAVRIPGAFPVDKTRAYSNVADGCRSGKGVRGECQASRSAKMKNSAEIPGEIDEVVEDERLCSERERDPGIAPGPE